MRSTTTHDGVDELRTVFGARVAVMTNGDVDARFVVDAAPGAAARLAAFGLQLRDETDIIVHADRARFQQATGRSEDWLRAWTTYRTIHLLPPSLWRDPSSTAAQERLAHELCHAAVYQRFGSEDGARRVRLSRSMQEGICSVVAGQQARRLSRDDVDGWRVAHPGVDVLDDQRFVDAPQIAYAAAHHAWARLAAARGNAEFGRVLDALAHGAPFVDAVGCAPSTLWGSCVQPRS